MGESWGADKAIEVANTIGLLLNSDPELQILYAGNRIQIHLRTIDAIGREGLGNKPSTRELTAKVASWANYFQQSDTGYYWLPGLRGQSRFPGAKNILVDFNKPPFNNGFSLPVGPDPTGKNGHHIGIAEAVFAELLGELYQ